LVSVKGWAWSRSIITLRVMFVDGLQMQAQSDPVPEGNTIEMKTHSTTGAADAVFISFVILACSGGGSQRSSSREQGVATDTDLRIGQRVGSRWQRTRPARRRQ